VDEPVPLDAVAAQGWTLADLQLPVLALREPALAHNLALMAAYCRDHDVALAPHGKTTMAPTLWRRQLDAGAWGITAANPTQARAMRDAGVPRVLIANEVVDPAGIAWLAGAAADPAFALTCYVDSARGIELLEARARSEHPMPVLVELGFAGGRTGCRDDAGAAALAARVRASDRLRLAGVSGYEGVICHDRSPACLERVGAFLDRLRGLAERVLADGPAETGEPFVVSAGGSVFFDLVAERLGPLRADGVRIVLRSGCYLTHDHGTYERTSPMPASLGEGGFHPALELWSAVLSRPEPGLALLGFGKRDAPHDLELPIPTVVRGSDRTTDVSEGALRVRQLNDQHAYVEVADGFVLEVGDVVGSGISHPCTAFDKWRVLPVLDGDDRVVDAVATVF
jgi:D-serine deaminase-like pyridoxal phosphate-dependent protein